MFDTKRPNIESHLPVYENVGCQPIPDVEPLTQSLQKFHGQQPHVNSLLFRTKDKKLRFFYFQPKIVSPQTILATRKYRPRPVVAFWIPDLNNKIAIFIFNQAHIGQNDIFTTWHTTLL